MKRQQLGRTLARKRKLPKHSSSVVDVRYEFTSAWLLGCEVRNREVSMRGGLYLQKKWPIVETEVGSPAPALHLTLVDMLPAT